MPDHFRSILDLHGVEIAAWVGQEMALGGGEAPLDEIGVATSEISPVVWDSTEFPFLQFNALDLVLTSGEVWRVMSALEECGDIYGLYAWSKESPADLAEASENVLFRTRRFDCLPVGRCSLISVRNDGDSILEAELTIGDQQLMLIAGEINDCHGELALFKPDQAVLVQVNGRRP